MITCGNCKAKHATPSDVRSCYGAAIRSVASTSLIPTANGLITPKQYSLIKTLLEERVVRDSLDLETVARLSKRTASNLIETLLACPKRPQVREEALSGTATSRTDLTGTYTVVLDATGENYVTLKFERAAKWAAGKTVVSFLSGPTNEVAYTGFAFLTSSGLQVWRRFKEDTRLVAAAQLLLTGDVDEAHERFLDRAEAYALRSGRCMRCGRVLTVPSSLHRGLGPDCAAYEGVSAKQSLAAS